MAEDSRPGGVMGMPEGGWTRRAWQQWRSTAAGQAFWDTSVEADVWTVEMDLTLAADFAARRIGRDDDCFMIWAERLAAVADGTPVGSGATWNSNYPDAKTAAIREWISDVVYTRRARSSVNVRSAAHLNVVCADSPGFQPVGASVGMVPIRHLEYQVDAQSKAAAVFPTLRNNERSRWWGWNEDHRQNHVKVWSYDYVNEGQTLYERMCAEASYGDNWTPAMEILLAANYLQAALENKTAKDLHRLRPDYDTKLCPGHLAAWGRRLGNALSESEGHPFDENWRWVTEEDKDRVFRHFVERTLELRWIFLKDDCIGAAWLIDLEPVANNIQQ